MSKKHVWIMVLVITALVGVGVFAILSLNDGGAVTASGQGPRQKSGGNAFIALLPALMAVILLSSRRRKARKDKDKIDG